MTFQEDGDRIVAERWRIHVQPDQSTRLPNLNSPTSGLGGKGPPEVVHQDSEEFAMAEESWPSDGDWSRAGKQLRDGPIRDQVHQTAEAMRAERERLALGVEKAWSVAAQVIRGMTK